MARSSPKVIAESRKRRRSEAELQDEERDLSKKKLKKSKNKIKQLQAQLAAALSLSSGLFYTYDFMKKMQLFETLLHVRDDEVDELISLLSAINVSKQFGIQKCVYEIKDYVVWFFAYVSGHAPSFNSISQMLSLREQTVHPVQVSRKIYWVAKMGAIEMKKKYIKFLSKEQMLAESAQIVGNNEEVKELHNKMLFIIDGTAVNVFKPGDIRMNRFLYCHFKHSHQIRFQVVTTLSGHVVHLTKLHEGHLGDSEAMKKDKLEKKSFFEKILSST